ncbi:MAG: PAS domain S-box protein [bacterium]
MSAESTVSAELAKHLLEQSPDAAIYAGSDGMIVFWNEAAERVFGHKAADAIGQSLDIIIPEEFRNRHWTAYDKALDAGDTKYRGQALATKSMKADGTAIYVELGFAMIHDASGATIGAMAVARDITERFNRDRETRRELRELKEAAKAN